MGIFRIIKAVYQAKVRNNMYRQMTAEELGRLSEEELLEALMERILAEEGDLTVDQCLETFQGAKRIFYIVNCFDMEVQNGCLCQFFVNSSRIVAPYLPQCLEAIGATAYKELLEEFVESNGIALDDLESFTIEEVEQFEYQTSRYPFEEFDDAYYDLYEEEPLEEFLLEYARAHIEDF